MTTTTTRRISLLQVRVFQRGHVLWRDFFRVVLAYLCCRNICYRCGSHDRRSNNLLFFAFWTWVMLLTLWAMATTPLLCW